MKGPKLPPIRRKLPAWVSPALVVLELLALRRFEKRIPLRPVSDDTIVRNGRNLFAGALAALAARLVEEPLTRRLTEEVGRRKWGLLKQRRLPPAFETLLALALLDYTQFAWHGLTHRLPLLWRFHLVHHLDRDLDATTALRFHFGEIVLSSGYRAAQIVVLGVAPLPLSLWQNLLLASRLFQHSNVALPERWERRLALFVVTPRLHGLHHAADERLAGTNWSSGLTLWDRLHGTLYAGAAGAAGDTPAIGVPAYPSDRDVAIGSILALPFRPQRDDWSPPPRGRSPG
ncbi:MAG: sterol desaturase family protein [Candidatus Baltobacteraceae bacterium]|jgi:sterol desaturase/sphingolipid hydroxylase (fatty acid hydroxylase superfamily)